MKAEKKPQAPVVHDIVLTLSPAEAKALYWIVADFDTAADAARSQYTVPGAIERFDVTLHQALLDLGGCT